MAALPYWRLSSFYLFYFALLGSTAPFLALYFDHLGFSSARIGELVAIPMLMRCVAPNLWGWLGDYTGRRLAIVRFGAVCTLACFSLILFDKSYAWLAMVMALHHRLHSDGGRTGSTVRVVQPGPVSPSLVADHGRNHWQQLVGAQCPTVSIESTSGG